MSSSPHPLFPFSSPSPICFLPHPHSVDWGSAAGWRPPPGCWWCCSCLWGAGGKMHEGLSSAGDAGRGASSTGPGTDQLVAAAAGNGSTAPEKWASGTSLPPGETLITGKYRGTHTQCLVWKQTLLFGELVIYQVATFPDASRWTCEALLFSASCLKDKKAARGVHAGILGPSSSSSSLKDISSLSLLLPGWQQIAQTIACKGMYEH